jgi:hypothetical protein
MHRTVKAARAHGAVYLPMIFTAPFTLLYVPSKLMKIIRTVSACSLLLVASSLFGSSLQEQNKAIAKRAFEEILSQGHFQLAEQLYAKDFVNHGIHRDASLEEDQAALKGWHQAFPDVVISPEKLIAEDDLLRSTGLLAVPTRGQVMGSRLQERRRNCPGLRSGGLSMGKSKRSGPRLISFR